MSKIAIVTDSTASIPQEMIDKFNIKVAPLVLLWGDKQYLDGVDIQAREFYDRLVESDVMPTTSQATIASFMQIYSELVAEGYQISHYSAFFQVIRNIRFSHPGAKSISRCTNRNR